MKIIKIADLDIEKVVDFLKNSKIIVYPTETCYGLGADAFDHKAVEKIFKIKNRNLEKSLILVISDLKMIIDYVEWNDKLEMLAKKYWPGPLTLVAKVKKNIFPKGIVSKDNTIAFRISNHPFVLDLCKKFNSPIISTSANLSLAKNPYSIKEIQESFINKKEKPDLIIDAGELDLNNPSTIASVVDDKIIILRQGELIIDEK
jgi:L-threonylcarbamoyladenylate synthase